MRKAVLCLVILLLASANSSAEVVWQIGEFDNDYREFALSEDYDSYARDFPGGVIFRAGTDDPATSWPFIHPGTADRWAGHRPHEFTVTFNLPERPTGVFTLTIDLVSAHGHSPPLYEINLNGRSGLVRLPRGSGDSVLTDTSVGSEHIIRLALPASCFQTGENTLVLRNVEGSWALYDALSLTNDLDVTQPPGINRVTLEPTIFLVKQGSGLKRVLRLSADLVPGTVSATAVVQVGEESTSMELEPDLMGRANVEVIVDEVTEPMKAEATILLGSKASEASCDLTPVRHWRLYLQASSHVDIGYTDFQERVIDLHNDNMSLALDLCDRYPDFKWNTESAWVQDNYLSMMPDDRKQQFIKYAKDGRIGCQVIYGNMLTGICSHESLIRTLYYARSASREHGIPFDIAMSSDVPTQVWTLPTVLAGSGIKYFSAGLNLTRGNSFNRLFHKPFYWQGPDGSMVLTWLQSSYGMADRLGLTTSLSRAEQEIERFLSGFEREDYPYNAVMAFGGIFDNVRLTETMAKVADEWNVKYAYPEIIFCRGREFFEYIESGFGESIPTISGCGGVYWEDGAGSSATETAMVRRAKESLATAEKIFSLASLYGVEYPKDEIDLAWKNAILYDEHTWGAHCSISQPEHEQTIRQWEYKARFAEDADEQSSDLLRQGLNKLADAVKLREPAILVFNPHSWPLSDWVTVDNFGGGHFYAENVPPCSYKIYDNSVLNAPDYSPVPAQTPVIENRYYRLELDTSTGAVKSLYDKELKKELVDAAAPYGINQFVYISGQGKDARDVTREDKTPPVEIKNVKYPDGEALEITGSVHMATIHSTIHLYDSKKRIDFRNSIDKTEITQKEAGYFAFPFALDKPEWYVSLPNGVVRPKSEMLDGACMQWYCTQDYVAAADEECAVVWTACDSPLITIGDINRETFQSPIPYENGHLYAYAFNNYWFTNYKASQGGDLLFRFSLTSMRKYDPVAATRFGQTVKDGLIAIEIAPDFTKKPSTENPQLSGSLCSVSPGNVIIQAVKQAESGDELIIRLRELSGRKTLTKVNLPPDSKEAWACNLVEDPVRRLPVSGETASIMVPANGLATLLVK